MLIILEDKIIAEIANSHHRGKYTWMKAQVKHYLFVHI